jgi:hypothetical protein
VRAQAPTRYVVRGTYLQPTVRLEDVKTLSKQTSSYRVDTGTIWHGDLEGRSTVVMYGVVDTRTSANKGTDDETFTGNVKGIGSGHLTFEESFQISRKGDLTLIAHILSGDGPLAGLHGSFRLTGYSNPVTGKRLATYTGHFSRA